MKKQGILNSEISRVLSYLGHTDKICIGDAGLPIPDFVERIDISLTLGTPKFFDTLVAVAEDMKIEAIVLAEEIKEKNPDLLKDILDFFDKNGNEPKVEISFVPHVELKAQTEDCKAVIRTGEATPYANIILQSACLF